jgi:hypothetical protein
VQSAPNVSAEKIEAKRSAQQMSGIDGFSGRKSALTEIISSYIPTRSPAEGGSRVWRNW